MARLALVLAFVVSALRFLAPKFYDMLHISPTPFLDLVLYLPAVLMGSWYWWKGRSFASSWPVVFCIGLAWIGLLYAGDSKSHRGLLIAALLTVPLPVAALIVEKRCWLLCAKTYVVANAAALAISLWLKSRAELTHPYLFLFRFGSLFNEDGSKRLASPNQVGGQLALASVLAFIVYLNVRSQSKPPMKVSGWMDRLGLGWTVFLSMGCLLTASRGAFVAWFAGMATLMVWGTRALSPNKLRDLVVLSVVGICLMLCVTTAAGFAPWKGLQSRFVDNDTVASLGNRTKIWNSALKAWWSDPGFIVHGTGTGMADEVLGRFHENPKEDDYGVLRQNCHSDFVEWTLSFGIVGIVAGVWLLATMAYKMRVLDRAERNVGRQAILVCLLLFSLTAVTYRLPNWMATGSLVLAMLSGSPARGRTSPSRRPATSATSGCLPAGAGDSKNPVPAGRRHGCKPSVVGRTGSHVNQPVSLETGSERAPP